MSHTTERFCSEELVVNVWNCSLFKTAFVSYILDAKDFLLT